LQEVGPAATIDAPALMLHGDDDPHPGQMIHASLKTWMPRLEYVSWPRCGHSPWRERGVREDFYRMLKAWLRDAPEPRSS
jgi:pimeloyl-ACP methyl ester carboxylesterase